MIQKELNRLFLIEEKNEYLGKNKEINKHIPLVSISVPTYNHENFIEECLDSILKQVTNFTFEIIIGEDQSDDRTREICIKYAEKYPNKIRLFLRDRKTSQYFENGKFICRFNGLWNRMSARGKYIAMCEGDDYWIDPLKLQKQVDFLEANEEYVIHSANASFYFQDEDNNKEILCRSEKEERVLTLKNFYTQNNLSTLTVMFRNVKFDYPKEYKNILYGDWALYTIILKNDGCLAYRSNEVFACYRIHNNGLMLSNSKVKHHEHEANQLIKIYEYLELSPKKYNSNQKATVTKVMNTYILDLIAQRNFKSVFKYLFFDIKINGIGALFFYIKYYIRQIRKLWH
ncbi:glycosyltransferase [Polaribacter sp. MSW13]|uniref:Glycosyltransferase n=1 Tax=Polaribacter marinus TaxID=2916838 RepID=A0A9X1VNA0_9FLAO|nr:glycosyltransferase [Polaribacter marinus]MCI2228382.1 glycosyltransferase [Polaribacter marinus]